MASTSAAQTPTLTQTPTTNPPVSASSITSTPTSVSLSPSASPSRDPNARDSNGLTRSDYKAIVITPVVVLFLIIIGSIVYRRYSRRKRDRKEGFSRELDPETGRYEMRPLGRVRVRGGVDGEGAREVERRGGGRDAQGLAPPSYSEVAKPPGYT